MIDVRLITRTHYQVVEPSVVAAVVLSCTSPIRSDFRDNVSRKLATSHFSLNPTAARYAIDLAKALGLLRDNLVWTNLGHLLHVVYGDKDPSNSEELSEIQKYFFLRVFLEFDGAAFIHFAKRLEEDGRVPRQREHWTEVAQRLFSDTYNEYLSWATDPQDRVRIRHLQERRRAKQFRGNSGRHQCFVHLHCLERLGFITKPNAGEHVYTPNTNRDAHGSGPIARLLELLPNSLELERTVSTNRLYDIVAELFGCRHQPDGLARDWFSDTVHRIYQRIVATGVSLCSLQTLTEAVQIELLALGHKPYHAQDVLNLIRSMQRDAPRAIRFHVDVSGRPAFLKIS